MGIFRAPAGSAVCLTTYCICTPKRPPTYGLVLSWSSEAGIQHISKNSQALRPPDENEDSIFDHLRNEEGYVSYATASEGPYVKSRES